MTGRLIPARDPSFRARFGQIRQSWFRLETLQRYGNSGEDAALAAFLAGQPEPPPDRNDGQWQAMIRANARAGRVMRRVHVVIEPLSDYMRFELTWAYGPNVAAGEEIRIISVPEGTPWPSDLPALGTDFWLLDSVELYRQHYGPDGDWVGTEPVDDPTRIAEARTWRDTAWNQGKPWADYVHGQERLIGYLPPKRQES